MARCRVELKVPAENYSATFCVCERFSALAQTNELWCISYYVMRLLYYQILDKTKTY